MMIFPSHYTGGVLNRKLASPHFPGPDGTIRGNISGTYTKGILVPLWHFSKLHLQKLFIVFNMFSPIFAKDQHVANVHRKFWSEDICGKKSEGGSQQ